MWRHVASLSQLVSSSKSRLLNQVCACSYGINAWQMITTQVLNQAEGGFSDRRTPFVTFVLGGPGSGKGRDSMNKDCPNFWVYSLKVLGIY
ncbi:hypothetical protein OROMI_008541 [Orobanche minor]